MVPLVAQTAESELVHQLLGRRYGSRKSPGHLHDICGATATGLFIAVVLGGLGLLVLAAFVEPVSAYEEPITVVGGRAAVLGPTFGAGPDNAVPEALAVCRAHPVNIDCQRRN